MSWVGAEHWMAPPMMAIEVAGSMDADVMRLSMMLPAEVASRAACAGIGAVAIIAIMASSNALSAASLVVPRVFIMFLLMSIRLRIFRFAPLVTVALSPQAIQHARAACICHVKAVAVCSG